MSGEYYESALLRLRRVTTHLNLRYTDVVREHNLTPVQFEILLYVGSNGSCTVTEISDFMVVDRSTSSRVLRGIEGKSLIQIIPDKVDRRKRNVVLSQEGQDLLDSVRSSWFAVEKDVRSDYERALEQLESI
jgi:DNA-binding MarR family transcriptional regulator